MIVILYPFCNSIKFIINLANLTLPSINGCIFTNSLCALILAITGCSFLINSLNFLSLILIYLLGNNPFIVEFFSV